MDYYKEIFKKVPASRDVVFKTALRYFPRPVNILEIGATRNPSEGSRKGDGWSSFFFLEHIDRWGGSLTICDIVEDNLKKCIEIISTYPNFENLKVEFLLGDGKDVVRNTSFDLYYLDGGDDPFDMVDQFVRIPQPAYILCDDFHKKGSVLSSLSDKCSLFKWADKEHQMAFYTPEERMTIVCNS